MLSSATLVSSQHAQLLMHRSATMTFGFSEYRPGQMREGTLTAPVGKPAPKAAAGKATAEEGGSAKAAAKSAKAEKPSTEPPKAEKSKADTPKADTPKKEKKKGESKNEGKKAAANDADRPIDVSWSDVRVGLILDAHPHPESDKLCASVYVQVMQKALGLSCKKKTERLHSRLQRAFGIASGTSLGPCAAARSSRGSTARRMCAQNAAACARSDTLRRSISVRTSRVRCSPALRRTCLSRRCASWGEGRA